MAYESGKLGMGSVSPRTKPEFINNTNNMSGARAKEQQQGEDRALKMLNEAKTPEERQAAVSEYKRVMGIVELTAQDVAAKAEDEGPTRKGPTRSEKYLTSKANAREGKPVVIPTTGEESNRIVSAVQELGEGIKGLEWEDNGGNKYRVSAISGSSARVEVNYPGTFGWTDAEYVGIEEVPNRIVLDGARDYEVLFDGKPLIPEQPTTQEKVQALRDKAGEKAAKEPWESPSAKSEMDLALREDAQDRANDIAKTKQQITDVKAGKDS